VFLHKYWHCHRLTNRSFFLRGRQFHICARCTGMLIGYFFSIFIVVFSINSIFLFLFFLLLMIVDGGSQLLKWRESNNVLRFVIGFGYGISFVPCIVQVIRQNWG
jgi:uncharacterized membrane protein